MKTNYEDLTTEFERVLRDTQTEKWESPRFIGNVNYISPETVTSYYKVTKIGNFIISVVVGQDDFEGLSSPADATTINECQWFTVFVQCDERYGALLRQSIDRNIHPVGSVGNMQFKYVTLNSANEIYRAVKRIVRSNSMG